MFPDSTMLNSVFWMAFGCLQVLVVAGAYAWLARGGKRVRWWQMALMYGGFAAFCVVVAGGFTLMGEYESVAGWYFIGVLGLPVIVVLTALVRFFVFPRRAGNGSAS